jgi:uncharacterized protein
MESAVAAGLVQGISGFGFSMVAVAIWVWAMPPSLITVLAVFGGLVGQLVAVISVRRKMDWAVQLPFLIGGLVGVPIGVWLLPQLNPATFKTAMGALLLVCCPLMLLKSQTLSPRPVNRFFNGIAGFLGGISGGIGGFSGVVPTLWCTWQQMEKDQQRSVVQTFNLSALALAMAGYVVTSTVKPSMLLPMVVVAASLLIPVLLGAKIFRGVSPARFRQIVLGLLTFAGAAMVWAGLKGNTIL